MNKENEMQKLEALFDKACKLLQETEDVNVLLWGLKELTEIYSKTTVIEDYRGL